MRARQRLVPAVTDVFTWELEGVTAATLAAAKPGEELDSPQFSAGGRQWFLRLYLSGQTAQDVGLISLFMHLAEADHAAHGSATADVTLRIREAHITKADRIFTKNSDGVLGGWGSCGLLSHDDDAAAWFPLPGDVLAITAEVTVKVPLQLAPAAAPPPPPSLGREMRAALASGVGADVKLLCAGQSLPAHSVILSIRSPVFAALLDAGSPLAASDRGAVPVPGEVTPATLARLLEFIYTDDLDPAPSAEEARRAPMCPLPLIRRWCIRVHPSSAPAPLLASGVRRRSTC